MHETGRILRKTEREYLNKYPSRTDLYLTPFQASIANEAMKRYAEEEMKDFYLFLVSKGKIIETNPFDCNIPVNEFLK